MNKNKVRINTVVLGVVEYRELRAENERLKEGLLLAKAERCSISRDLLEALCETTQLKAALKVRDEVLKRGCRLMEISNIRGKAEMQVSWLEDIDAINAGRDDG